MLNVSREKTRRFVPPKYLERLADAFNRTGLSLQSLADRAGLRHWEVARFLAGSLGGDFEKYRRFADALGMPWSFLLIGPEGLEEIERWNKRGRVTLMPPTAPAHASAKPKVPQRRASGQ